MIVTLIGKDIIYKTRLPQVPMGNYWLTGENGKKLINIEAENGVWTINSTSHFKILKPQSIKKLNVAKIANDETNILYKCSLAEYSIHYLYIGDLSNNVFVLYCSPSFDDNFVNLKMNVMQEIKIGSSNDNDIIYQNPLVKQHQARIFLSNGKLLIENYDDNFGTFVNNISVGDKQKLLFNGDIIYIMGLKIILIGSNVFINTPFNKVGFNKNIFYINSFNLEKIDENDEEDDEEVELYTDDDFFARAPRIVNLIERETIKIDPPPQNQNKEGTPLIYVLGSSMTMGLISVVTMASTIDRLASGESSLKDSIFSIIISMAMMVSMILFPILNRRYEKKQREKMEKTRQDRYKSYINSKIEQIDDIMEKQSKILFENYISAEECAKNISERGPRLWERKIDSSDFLTVRLGIGDLPLNVEIQYPAKEFTMEDDNLVEILNTVANKSKILKDVPITYSLVEKNISALIVKNNARLQEKFAQNLIVQLVALHSYTDLKLVFLLSKETAGKMEHLKTLPHIWDDLKQTRFWADNYEDMKEISSYLDNELMNRINIKNNDVDYKSFRPYYLIITDDYKKIENLEIINKILGMKKNFGFSLFCITDNLLHLPNECKIFININKEKGTLYENEMTYDAEKEFKFDETYTFFFENIGRNLSNIPIKLTSSGKNALPSTYTFLEMYDAGKIEQLNALERWRTNDSTISLKAPIGIDSAGMPIVLDVHEKFHGPHGLIAGSTGSGKSEFIITYILSLAVNYNPDDVNIIIIDYKGGGLAGAFKKGKVQLPHLVGTITNIETVGLQRSLASIQSELRRRQIKFNEAREKTNEGTIDIYKYQKLYHNGIVNEPIPHLLIISDEFAELKQQQEDFMNELISVARIGRSLGVHLILATQKPAGVVNEQISSNSRFRICLKVQDASDSVDVIKRPDAANLRGAGQFYMLVGNNEYFTLGQSAWAGAPYIPSDTIRKNVDNSVKFVSGVGTVIKDVDDTKKVKLNSKGEQLTNIVKYLSDLAIKENIQEKPLWMENIPELIFLDKIREKYHIISKPTEINPVIGEFDDPYNQRQGPVTVNFSDSGNIIIYGNAESGKESLVSTLVYDIMTNYTADYVQMYLIDFGSEALKIFKNGPTVGDVVFQNDSEKINRLFDMLQKELKERTQIISDYGGDYKLYITTSNKTMPMLLIVINNYEAFSESYGNQYEDLLLTLSRDGLKCGIVFLFTASTYNDIRYRLSQNFRQKLALQVNNSDDYLNIFDNVGKKRPSHYFGRGLVKMEDIYEFQTARICESEEWNNFITKKIEELNSKAKYFAKKIPVLPKIVNIEDVKSEIKSLSKVPIGLDKRTIEISTYNFTSDLVTIITGKNIESIAQFINNLIQIFKMIKDAEVVILDVEQLLNDNSEKIDLNLQNLMLEINNNIKKEKTKICIIIGIEKFLNNIQDETSFNELLRKADKLDGYRFIIVDTVSKIKNREYDSWFKNFASKESGIWIGNGVTDQYLINLNANIGSLDNNCGQSFGYKIRREEPIQIKLLGIDEEIK